MTQSHKTSYRLLRGDTILGYVTSDNTKFDQPWFAGTFKPSAEFETVRPLFERELRLLDTLDTDTTDEYEALWEVIEGPGLRLESIDTGESIHGMLIHIDGDTAWWRECDG